MNNTGWVKCFYKSGGKTGLNEAENGSEFTTGQFAEKNAKMRGVGYFVDWQRLSSYFCFSGASSFSKRYIPMKKSQCLFFTRTIFLSKNMPFWSKNWPFQRLKSCTKPIRVCSFWATLMLIRWPTDGKPQPFRFYFTNFICKEIGIKILYIFESFPTSARKRCAAAPRPSARLCRLLLKGRKKGRGVAAPSFEAVSDYLKWTNGLSCW